MISKQSPPPPPSSNTGAEITAPSENRCLIDFCSFTLKVESPHDALSLLGLKSGLFSDMAFGGMGYRRSMRYGNIVVYYDGNDDMGVHVSMSGQGCRQYEGQFSRPSAELWPFLFQLVLSQGGSITRLDLAIDNVDGLLSLDKVRRAVKNGQIRSRFKQAREINSIHLGRARERFTGGESVDSDATDSDAGTGTTVYFGSVSSRLQFRIYDKRAETGCQCDHWVRFELQLRDERASNAVKHLMVADVGYVAVGIINQYLAFVNLDDSNISRCSLSDWWELWIGGVQRIKLTTAQALKYVCEVMTYVRKQYGPTFAMIKRYLGTVGFHGFLNDLIADGKDRLNTRHQQMLAISQMEVSLC